MRRREPTCRVSGLPLAPGVETRHKSGWPTNIRSTACKSPLASRACIRCRNRHQASPRRCGHTFGHRRSRGDGKTGSPPADGYPAGKPSGGCCYCAARLRRKYCWRKKRERASKTRERDLPTSTGQRGQASRSPGAWRRAAALVRWQAHRRRAVGGRPTMRGSADDS